MAETQAGAQVVQASPTLKIPQWIHGQINEDGLAKVREAVRKAETKTSAEIVPMVVQRSSAIAHVPTSVFLLLALIWMTVLPFVAGAITQVSMLVVEVGGVVLAFLLSMVVARMTWVQRLFVPGIDQEAQVDDRAELEFFESNIKATRDSTGILIFVSMLEHRAVVLADKAIADKFPPDTWNEIVRGLLERIKGGDLAGAMAWAIERSGDLVSPYFPVRAGDTNELGNDLVIKL